MRKLFRVIVLLVAVMAPVTALSATARDAGAEEGCECQESHCSKADTFCEWLICSDGTTKECKGKHVET